MNRVNKFLRGNHVLSFACEDNEIWDSCTLARDGSNFIMMNPIIDCEWNEEELIFHDEKELVNFIKKNSQYFNDKFVKVTLQ